MGYCRIARQARVPTAAAPPHVAAGARRDRFRQWAPWLRVPTRAPHCGVWHPGARNGYVGTLMPGAVRLVSFIPLLFTASSGAQCVRACGTLVAPAAPRCRTIQALSCPCTVMVSDYTLVAKICLYSYGYCDFKASSPSYQCTHPVVIHSECCHICMKVSDAVAMRLQVLGGTYRWLSHVGTLVFTSGTRPESCGLFHAGCGTTHALTACLATHPSAQHPQVSRVGPLPVPRHHLMAGLMAGRSRTARSWRRWCR